MLSRSHSSQTLLLFLVCSLVTPIFFGDLPQSFAGSGRIGAKATGRIHMIGKWIIPSSLRGPWFEWGSSFTGRLFKWEATHFGTSYISLGAVGFKRAHIAASQGRPDGTPYDEDEPRCTLMLLLLIWQPGFAPVFGLFAGHKKCWQWSAYWVRYMIAFCVTTCSTELTRHSMKSHFPSSNFLLNLKKKSSNRQHPRHNAFDINYNPLHDTWYDTEHPSSVAKKAPNQVEKCLLLRPNLQGKKLLILHRAAENRSSTSSTRGYCHLPLRPRWRRCGASRAHVSCQTCHHPTARIWSTTPFLLS